MKGRIKKKFVKKHLAVVGRNKASVSDMKHIEAAFFLGHMSMIWPMPVCLPTGEYEQVEATLAGPIHRLIQRPHSHGWLRQSLQKHPLRSLITKAPSEARFIDSHVCLPHFYEA